MLVLLLPVHVTNIQLTRSLDARSESLIEKKIVGMNGGCAWLFFKADCSKSIATT
jgi:hypothetical protein